MLNKSTITSNLITSFITILILSFVIGGLIVINLTKERYEEKINKNMQFITEHTTDHVIHDVQILSNELFVIVNTRGVEQYNINFETGMVAETFTKYQKQFEILTFLDADKEVIVKVQNGEPSYTIGDNIDLEFRDKLISEALKTPNKVVYSNIVYSKILNKPSIVFMINKVNFFDENLGFILGVVPIDDIFITTILDIDEGYEYRVLNNDDKVVFSSIENDTIKQYKHNFKENILQKQTVNGVESYIYLYKTDFGDIFLTLPYRYYEDMISKSIKNNLWIFILLLLITLVIVYILAKKITNPLLQLVKQIKGNHTGLRVNVESDYQEISVLTETFNYLGRELENDRKSLMELNKNLENRIKQEVEKNSIKEKQLYESAKMVQMGEMIGNIAHQWRQPLSAISANASGVRLDYDFDMLKIESIPKRMDDIVESTQYLSETINTFRDFIKEKKELKRVILQDNIDNTLQIIGPALKAGYIEIKNDINYDELITISMVTGELSQVLINILNNAKDILIERKIENPSIKISLEEKTDKAVITIEDNGGGIPDDILPRIFEPYFTTKHQSQGTGLGLHMSYKIITESLNGLIYVKNTNDGAKFFIELPLDVVE